MDLENMNDEVSAQWAKEQPDSLFEIFSSPKAEIGHKLMALSGLPFVSDRERAISLAVSVFEREESILCKASALRALHRMGHDETVLEARQSPNPVLSVAANDLLSSSILPPTSMVLN